MPRLSRLDRIHRTIVARIYLLLIQITVRDRTVNIRSCYASVDLNGRHPKGNDSGNFPCEAQRADSKKNVTSDSPRSLLYCGIRCGGRIDFNRHVTRSHVYSSITCSDSTTDTFALQLYGEFNWKYSQIGLLCSLCDNQCHIILKTAVWFD